MTWGFVTCGPNEALVVSGCCHTKPLLVPGGRAFVWPSIQCVQSDFGCDRMVAAEVAAPLSQTKRVTMVSSGSGELGAAKLTGEILTIVNVMDEEGHEYRRNRVHISPLPQCSQHEDEIQNIALVTLEGHQRAIMGSMSVEDIYKDRKKFSKQVFQVASSDLVNMGITVVSYTLKDIRDDEGYLKSLGMARTAEVKRDARIGEAEAQKDARIKEAMAEEEKMAARFVNDTEIAKAQRDFEIKKATYDAEVETKRAEAELAFELQAAKTKQRIKEEQMKIQVIERNQEIQVQEQEIQRRKKELESSVNRPAEAEKYRIEKLAQANKKRLMIEAEAEAEAIRLKGEAEAAAIAAKARAEVEIMTKKAEAWKDYREAAVIDMILESLPKDIYKDRKKFSKQVFQVASSDLVNMGITVVSYTLKDIRDDEGYLKSLGMARTAEVKRDARIGEAEAKKDARIKEAMAEEEKMAARFVNDTEIAKAQRDFEIKKATYDAEVETKMASRYASNLQQACEPALMMA
ncbi:flotillin-1 [Diaphorina citri]|uniref:Flotillin-1 n=1 Tax=Diaphorina citri TaxID=121845 RepID=A0A1S3DAR7_DIACI|nr:flotillin-1 [Diaphorina citri]